MTEVELEYPRADAVELVRAAFEEAPNFVSYTIEGDGEKIVGVPRAGATSLGEEVVVWIPREQDGATTTIVVRARRRVGLNFASNPWKYKSEFLAGVRDLRGEPVSAFRRPAGSGRRDSRDETPDADGDGVADAGADAVDDTVDPTADAWLRTARVVGVMLLGLFGLIALVVVLTALLP